MVVNLSRRMRVLVATAVLGTLLAGCAEEVRSDSDLEVPAESAKRLSLTAAPTDSTESAGYVAHLYSEHDADVYTRMFGDEGTASGIRVDAIHVELGDRVRRGQALATLDDEMAALEVELARPEAEETERQLQRLSELHERGIITPSEYDEALYAHRRAQAAFDLAELYLARTRVRAPFDGIVSRRYVREGELVDDRTPLFRITAPAPLRARLLVPEDGADAFSAGAAVRLTGGSLTAVGRVLIVGPTVDPASGTREVIVELRDPAGFRPGAAVTAELAASSAAEGGEP